MSLHIPDAWVILEIENQGKTIHKVLAGWYGGYAGTDSWLINSGITKIVEEEHYYYIHGYSGSVYQCAKNEERFTGLTASIYRGFVDELKKSGLGSLKHIDISKALLDRYNG